MVSVKCSLVKEIYFIFPFVIALSCRENGTHQFHSRGRRDTARLVGEMLRIGRIFVAESEVMIMIM